MNLSCAREKEVADLLHRGHWPHACPLELRAHVSQCRACSERIIVAQAFQEALAHAAPATLPSPGALWWRAQLRRRNAAIERIGKPILGAQLFALAVTLMAGAGLLASQGRQVLRWISWLIGVPGSLHLPDLWPNALPGLSGTLIFLVPILATLALVSGVVVYLASEKQ